MSGGRSTTTQAMARLVAERDRARNRVDELEREARASSERVATASAALVEFEHGLDADAALFLQGSTVEEVEASAAVLAKLLRKRDELDTPADLFAGAAARKAERQQALVDALTGRAPQRRDGRGRFAGGFDGGARTPVQVSRAPEVEHGHLIGQMASISRTFRG
jgi:hypothetical protein